MANIETAIRLNVYLLKVMAGTKRQQNDIFNVLKKKQYSILYPQKLSLKNINEIKAFQTKENLLPKNLH